MKKAGAWRAPAEARSERKEMISTVNPLIISVKSQNPSRECLVPDVANGYAWFFLFKE